MDEGCVNKNGDFVHAGGENWLSVNKKGNFVHRGPREGNQWAVGISVRGGSGQGGGWRSA